MSNPSIESPRVQRGMLPAFGLDKTMIAVIAGICVTVFLILSAFGQEPASSDESSSESSSAVEDRGSVFSEPHLLGADFKTND